MTAGESRKFVADETDEVSHGDPGGQHQAPVELVSTRRMAVARPLGKQVITDDGRRDAACTARWCIGAA
jgi:hypothetical protein